VAIIWAFSSGFLTSCTSICGLSILNLTSRSLVNFRIIFPDLPMIMPGFSALIVI